MFDNVKAGILLLKAVREGIEVAKRNRKVNIGGTESRKCCRKNSTPSTKPAMGSLVGMSPAPADRK